MQTDQPNVTQPDTPTRMTSRELWRRYRRISLLSLVPGAFMGCVVVFILGGDGRMIGYKFVLGSSFGVATAAIACLGGFIALRVQYHKKKSTCASRVNAGSAGAGIAVLLIWLLFATWAAISGGPGLWITFTLLPIAIISGVVTWGVAAAALQWVERKDRTA